MTPHRRSAQRRARPRRVAALALAGVLVAAACGGGGGSGDQRARSSAGLRRLTVALDWTPNTNHSGVYLAKARGWYRDAGLDVKIVSPGDAGSLQLLGTGKADVAFTTQEEIIPARAEGVPVVAISSVIQHNTSSLVALRRSGITRPRDLEGKTYGGYGGQLEKALVRTLVSCDGGDPSKVRFTEVGNVDYRVGMQRGDYDFVWIFDAWDGIRYTQIDKLPVTTIPFIRYTRCIPDWYTPMLATSEKALTKDRSALRAFMAATVRGYQAAIADPGAAAGALLKAVPELDPRLVQASARYLAPRYADDPGRWGRQDAAVWRRMAAFLRTSGLLRRDIDVSRAFTNDLLPASGR
ncbi:MAG: ABC transporter substrate-binding protein [Actinobacteria bacterium]|nr:ABC transporter substrate-binding protein [Actinomycetota bacterium]